MRLNRFLGGNSRATFSQAKAKGDSSPLRSDGSCDNQTGGPTGCPVAKNTQMRAGKQLQAAKGPNPKQAERQPKMRVNLLFLMGI
jgi:hypothetical protein